MLAGRLMIVALVLTSLAGWPVLAQDRTEDAVLRTGGTSTLELVELSEEQRRMGVLREGRVRLPRNAFEDTSDSGDTGAVRIAIDTDRTVELQASFRESRGRDSVYVIGYVEGQPQSSRFVFLLREGVPYRGEIRIRGEVINLMAPRVLDGFVELRFRATDPSVVKDGAPPANAPPIAPSALGIGEDTAADPRFSGDEPGGADGSDGENPEVPRQNEQDDSLPGETVVVDLMVVYTSDAETYATAYHFGDSMHDIIDWQVYLANIQLGFQANVRLELVYHGQVSYTEDGDMEEDLARLACPCDDRIAAVGSNNLNEVFEPWTESGADIVSLWVHAPLSGYAGVAYQNWHVTPEFAPRAVNVVDWRQATNGNLSFDHEIGHAFGALHDRAQENDVSSAYNYGFINYSQKLSSIMAYASTCESFGVNCERDYKWSSSTTVPQLGIATGVHAADNARALRENAIIVASHDSEHNLVGCCINYGNFFVRRWRPGPCP